MKTLAPIIIIIALLVGCTPAPRYGHYAEKRPVGQKPQGPSGMSVDDYLRLGAIMRGKLGTPYLGTSKYKAGTDCSNLTQEVFDEFGGVTLGRSAQDQFADGVPVGRNRLQFGDLVFFSLKKNKITHVGIYVGYGDFIHASESYGVILSRLNDKYWAHSFAGARRVLSRPSH